MCKEYRAGKDARNSSGDGGEVKRNEKEKVRKYLKSFRGKKAWVLAEKRARRAGAWDSPPKRTLAESQRCFVDKKPSHSTGGGC